MLRCIAVEAQTAAGTIACASQPDGAATMRRDETCSIGTGAPIVVAAGCL